MGPGGKFALAGGCPSGNRAREGQRPPASRSSIWARMRHRTGGLGALVSLTSGTTGGANDEVKLREFVLQSSVCPRLAHPSQRPPAAATYGERVQIEEAFRDPKSRHLVRMPQAQISHRVGSPPQHRLCSGHSMGTPSGFFTLRQEKPAPPRHKNT